MASQSEAAPAVVEPAVDPALRAAADTAGRKARRRDIALAGAAAFDRCLARPPLVRHGSFALHLFWQSLLADVDAGVDAEVDADVADASAVARDEPGWRLGLVIPKRYEASAVARNTIKRRWRDAFRRERAAWAAEFGPADLVVRMQSPLVKKTDPPVPARVRARDRFEPQDALTLLVTRLRSKRGPSASSSGTRVGTAVR